MRNFALYASEDGNTHIIPRMASSSNGCGYLWAVMDRCELDRMLSSLLLKKRKRHATVKMSLFVMYLHTNPAFDQVLSANQPFDQL
ncbi:MAG TPA: hypothetical protein VFK31_09770 [Rhodanobacteraceae bacterium]|nr:hypothetical protein [Rhodanobacteraceae bacterium]